MEVVESLSGPPMTFSEHFNSESTKVLKTEHR